MGQWVTTNSISIGPRPHTHRTYKLSRESVNNFGHLQTFYNYLINFNWVSGSPTTYFPFILSPSAFLMKKTKFQKIELKKFNWVSGSPPILYKLVLGPTPIVHTNFQENPLTTLGISRHFKII